MGEKIKYLAIGFIGVLFGLIIAGSIANSYYTDRYDLDVGRQVCEVNGFERLGDMYVIGGNGNDYGTVRQLGISCEDLDGNKYAIWGENSTLAK